jgi:mRNA deadenylase 3'-5' endonuclease subunit Ccr4
LRKILEMPEEEKLAKETGIPSSMFPSDHLPIYAEFIFKSD